MERDDADEIKTKRSYLPSYEQSKLQQQLAYRLCTLLRNVFEGKIEELKDFLLQMPDDFFIQTGIIVISTDEVPYLSPKYEVQLDDKTIFLSIFSKEKKLDSMQRFLDDLQKKTNKAPFDALCDLLGSEGFIYPAIEDVPKQQSAMLENPNKELTSTTSLSPFRYGPKQRLHSVYQQNLASLLFYLLDKLQEKTYHGHTSHLLKLYNKFLLALPITSQQYKSITNVQISYISKNQSLFFLSLFLTRSFLFNCQLELNCHHITKDKYLIHQPLFRLGNSLELSFGNVLLGDVYFLDNLLPRKNLVSYVDQVYIGTEHDQQTEMRNADPNQLIQVYTLLENELWRLFSFQKEIVEKKFGFWLNKYDSEISSFPISTYLQQYSVLANKAVRYARLGILKPPTMLGMDYVYNFTKSILGILSSCNDKVSKILVENNVMISVKNESLVLGWKKTFVSLRLPIVLLNWMIRPKQVLELLWNYLFNVSENNPSDKIIKQLSKEQFFLSKDTNVKKLLKTLEDLKDPNEQNFIFSRCIIFLSIQLLVRDFFDILYQLGYELVLSEYDDLQKMQSTFTPLYTKDWIPVWMSEKKEISMLSVNCQKLFKNMENVSFVFRNAEVSNVDENNNNNNNINITSSSTTRLFLLLRDYIRKQDNSFSSRINLCVFEELFGSLWGFSSGTTVLQWPDKQVYNQGTLWKSFSDFLKYAEQNEMYIEDNTIFENAKKQKTSRSDIVKLEKVSRDPIYNDIILLTEKALLPYVAEAYLLQASNDLNRLESQLKKEMGYSLIQQDTLDGFKHPQSINLLKLFYFSYIGEK